MAIYGYVRVSSIDQNACGNPAPFAKTLPYLNGIGGGLFLFEQKVKLVNIEPRCFLGGSVDCHPVPYSILENQHTQLFKLLAKFLYIEADQTVFHAHV